MPDGHKTQRRNPAPSDPYDQGPEGPVVGELLELQAGDRPGGRFRNIAHTWTLAGGRYRFTRVRSNRDTRYRVIDAAAANKSGPVVLVTVELSVYPQAERVLAAARYLAGRAGQTAFALVDDDDAALLQCVQGEGRDVTAFRQHHRVAAGEDTSVGLGDDLEPFH